MPSPPQFTLNPPAWSPAEEAVLLKHYPTSMSLVDIAAMLPGRTVTGAEKWARKRLGLKRPRPNDWLPEQVSLLVEKYPSLGGKGLEKELGRNAATISRKANEMQIEYIGKGYRDKSKPRKQREDEYTEAEEAILQKHYATRPNKELIAMLPGRPVKGFAAHARSMGLSKNSTARQAPREKKAVEQKTNIVSYRAKDTLHGSVTRAAKAKHFTSEETPWYREPHNSDAYKEGLANHLAGKKKTVFIDEYGRQAFTYKRAA